MRGNTDPEVSLERIRPLEIRSGLRGMSCVPSAVWPLLLSGQRWHHQERQELTMNLQARAEVFLMLTQGHQIGARFPALLSLRG